MKNKSKKTIKPAAIKKKPKKPKKLKATMWAITGVDYISRAMACSRWEMIDSLILARFGNIYGKDDRKKKYKKLRKIGFRIIRVKVTEV